MDRIGNPLLCDASGKAGFVEFAQNVVHKLAPASAAPIGRPLSTAHFGIVTACAYATITRGSPPPRRRGR